jgi:hypothetical protein
MQPEEVTLSGSMDTQLGRGRIITGSAEDAQLEAVRPQLALGVVLLGRVECLKQYHTFFSLGHKHGPPDRATSSSAAP